MVGTLHLTQADELLSQAVGAGGIPGVVAMAATRDGATYSAAYGHRALDEDGKPAGAAMTADTVFWIASMTKAITSMAAMQLVEQGKLELDAPLGKLLPELARPKILEGFDAAGEPKLRDAKESVTLRRLLTHTAGFGYDIWDENLVRYQEKKGIPGITSCTNASLMTPLLFEPGSQWEYGINIDWAGKAVEKASGQNLEEYFRDHIFAPLGMKDTAFKLSPERRTRLAGMHARTPDGKLAPMPFEIPQEPEFHMGGGGLYGSAPDYLAFASLFLHEGRHNGKAVLKPETVRAMSENQMGATNVRLLKTAIPPYSNDAEFFPGMVKKWSTGFMINTETVPGGRSAGSLAWAGLGNTYYWIDQKKGVAGVIMSQIVPFADAKVLSLFDAFEKTVYRALN